MIEKEVSDALHVLLHCALKDKEYETQKEQFNFVYDYIFKLENNWNELKKWLEFMIKQEREGKKVYISLKDILNKMQELEQRKDE